MVEKIFGDAECKIEILYKYGIYAIFVNNVFYCTCETWAEARAEISAIKKEYLE